MKKLNLVIVGNGMVGHHLVERLVEANAMAQFNITRDRGRTVCGL